VIAVDSGSRDDSALVSSQLFGKTLTGRNQGLSSANNRGARSGDAPFILFCNPDVVIDPVGLQRLEARLRNKAKLLVGPRLESPTGEPQDNARGWPTLYRQIRNRLRPELGGYNWPVAPDASGPVPWLVGAAIAMSRTTFDDLNGWCDGYFLYYEDVDLSLRCWQTRGSVEICGDVRWLHHWLRHSRGLNRSTLRHLASAVRFYRRHPRLLFLPPDVDD
jgi:GT2 family glycosyltransferase